ncbi:MAG: CHC2 zinc finger domain-containing protein [Chloroflexota bacterium]|nr:hypothetical protein [Chloroflexota bacterium]MBI5704207.1 hypothetical protein [Chloroflexota bacterium]
MTINRTVELLPLVGHPLRKAGGYHVGACPFCGGEDRFTVKHTPNGDRWHCRHCGGGKYHTVIDFVMRRDNADFKAAVKILGGEITAPARPAARPKPQPLRLPSAEWQAKAWREVDAAMTRLFTPHGAAARAFLQARGLSFAMWETFLLGFGMVYDHVVERKRPAIVIPWRDAEAGKETITAVKYRFIDADPNPKALRYSSKKGSTFEVPFGMFDILPGFHHTLLLVEGEFNGISVAQCRPAGMSVLSFGSEGGGRFDVLRAIAAKYERVFVWADDVWDNPKQAKRAEELRSLVKGGGRALRSVRQDGVKWDANQLLQAGVLAEFVRRKFGVEAQE